MYKYFFIYKSTREGEAHTPMLPQYTSMINIILGLFDIHDLLFSGKIVHNLECFK